MLIYPNHSTAVGLCPFKLNRLPILLQGEPSFLKASIILHSYYHGFRLVTSQRIILINSSQDNECYFTLPGVYPLEPSIYQPHPPSFVVIAIRFVASQVTRTFPHRILIVCLKESRMGCEWLQSKALSGRPDGGLTNVAKGKGPDPHEQASKPTLIRDRRSYPLILS